MNARVNSAIASARHARRYLCAGVGVLSAIGFMARTTPAHAVAEGEIVLGDITVMRIRTAAGNVTAAQRASMVQERINEVLAVPGLKANDVHIVKTAYGPTLYVRKIKLITIDPDTAKDQSMTQDELAKTWAHRLMGVIAQVDIRVPGGPGDPVTTPPATTPGIPAAPGTPATPANPATPPVANPATPAAPATPEKPATPPAPAPTTPAPATPTPTTPAPATPAPKTPGETSPSP